MEQDFQEIHELATESGTKAIIDEARYHEEDLTEKFSELDDFYSHAFWTFLERPQYLTAAAAFSHADSLPTSYWRKRKNIPLKEANVSKANIYKFEQALGNYFHTIQGRGANCKIDCYKRDNLDYFFAYPENYAQANIEWDDKELKRRSYRPAFEVIFVYSQNDGTLDIYISSDRKSVPELQEIFAEVILDEILTPDEKDDRVYNLNPLLERTFVFDYDVDSGIDDVVIKKLRLKLNGKNERITLEAEPLQNKHAVFDLLDKMKVSHFNLTQVGIKVTFANNPSSRKNNTRSFSISYPNSCTLKLTGRDLIIRKMLIDSKIEPKEKTVL